jgi:hypothetical protein
MLSLHLAQSQCYAIEIDSLQSAAQCGGEGLGFESKSVGEEEVLSSLRR